MPPRTRLTPEQRREQILAAVEEVAAAADLEKVPTATLAAAAGVSEGLLFHYFPNRRALQLAVVERSAEALVTAMHNVPEQPSPERLLAALATYLDHVEANPRSWRVLLRASADAEVAAVLARVDELSLGLLLHSLDSDAEHAPPALLATLRAWLAFEKDVCAGWLDDPAALSRDALIAVLAGALLGALQGLAGTDDASASLLATILPPG